MLRFLGFWRDVFRRFSRHHVPRMAAALAFYGLFAVPPLLVFALVVAGQLFGSVQARDGVLEQVEAVGGEPAREAVDDLLTTMPQPGSGAPFSQGLGAFALFFAATAGFTQLESCLNQIVGRKPRRRGIHLLLSSAKRILGFGFVIGFSLLLLAVTTFGVTLQLSPEAWIAELPDSLRPVFSGLVHRVGLFLVAFVGLGTIYKFLPDRRVGWGAAATGALVAASLILLLKGAVALYLRHSWRNVAFGAASSVVGLLVSFYAAAMVVLLGAVVASVDDERRAAG